MGVVVRMVMVMVMVMVWHNPRHYRDVLGILEVVVAAIRRISTCECDLERIDQSQEEQKAGSYIPD